VPQITPKRGQTASSATFKQEQSSPWHTTGVTDDPPQQAPQQAAAPTGTPSIATLASREVYRNPWMRLREDQILRSNGKKGIYGVVEKDDSAIILPIENDRIWLVEQFRYTIQERALELPQGGWEMEIDNPEELARGELKEETGIHADSMVYLGQLWIAYGFTRQKQHVFLATGLSHVERNPDEEEHDIVVRCVPIAEFEQMMLDGLVRDGCTLAAWGLYRMWQARRA
jgi:ADP-ribose pyrophosphatase